MNGEKLQSLDNRKFRHMCGACTPGCLILAIVCMFLCGFVTTLVGIAIRIDDWLIVVYVGISILVFSIILGTCLFCNASKCCYNEDDFRRIDRILDRFSMTNFGTTVSSSRRKPLDVRILHRMDERKHQDRHGKLAQLLQEEIEQQGEEDIPTVCDKLKDQWQLPDEDYGLFEMALLAHLVHHDERFGSVKDAAKYLLRQETRDWKISAEFRRKLMHIRSNEEPENYTSMANIYVLLKSKSDDIGHQDYSPRSALCDVKPTLPSKGMMKNLSAPFDEITNGATPTAPLVQSSDIVIDVSPPNYDEVDK